MFACDICRVEILLFISLCFHSLYWTLHIKKVMSEEWKYVDNNATSTRYLIFEIIDENIKAYYICSCLKYIDK